MLYDSDIDFWEVKGGKVFIEYFACTEQATFTRDDLIFLLKLIDDSDLCKHENADSCVIRDDDGLQVIWVYSACSDCGYLERVPVRRDLSVGDKEILSGEQQ